MKTIFFGTPEYAVPFLKLLCEQTEVIAVITRQDKPAGRKQILSPSPAKIFAEKQKISVLQPEKLKDPLLLENIKQLNPDLGIVVAFGRIIPKVLFDIPRLGCLNVHFSLLPLYRGAAPVQWALINGETITGVTTFWIDEGMDTGPVVLQDKIPIEHGDDTATLLKKLVPLGLKTLESSLKLIIEGKAERIMQTGRPSFSPPLTREHARINWSLSSQQIYNLIRGLALGPAAYTTYQDSGKAKQLKILKGEPLNVCPGINETCPPQPKPGEITGIAKNEGFVVKCIDGFLKVLHVQPEGKPAMSAWSFWQGARLKPGSVLV